MRKAEVSEHRELGANSKKTVPVLPVNNPTPELS